MTITLNLPPDVDAATARGVALDSFVTEVLINQSPAEAPNAFPEKSEVHGLTEEEGLVVYKTGRPLPAGHLDEASRRSRDQRGVQVLGDHR